MERKKDRRLRKTTKRVTGKKTEERKGMTDLWEKGRKQRRRRFRKKERRCCRRATEEAT